MGSYLISEIRKMQHRGVFPKWTLMVAGAYVAFVSPKPEPEQTLGQRLVIDIEEAAGLLGITQGELVRRARLGTTAFNSYKNGITSPTVEKLEALCGVTQKRLTARVEPLHPPKKSGKPEGVVLYEETRRTMQVMETLDEQGRADVLALALSVQRLQGVGAANPHERDADEGASRAPRNKS